MTKRHLEQSSEQPDSETNGYPEDIGHYLRGLRIKSGIEIRDAARETKISASSIVAIEDHNYDALPADTFTRGLVTIYGDYLGENGKALAELFIQGRHDTNIPDNSHRKGHTGKVIKPVKFAERTHVPPAVVACIVLLFVITALFILYNYTSWNPLRSTLSKPEPSNLPPASSSVVSPAPPPPQPHAIQAEEDRAMQDSPTPNDDIKSDENENEDATSPEILNPTNEEHEQPTELEPQTGEVPENIDVLPEGSDTPSLEALTTDEVIREDTPENITVPQPPPASGPKYVLSLTFLKDTWVDVTSDNGPQVRHIADQGDTRIIEAEKWINLNFGKPESARIRLNGIEIDCPDTPDETGHVSLSIPEDILD